jgi:hypothetical protein
VQKFKRDPKVGLKVMTVLTRYKSLADETSLSPNWDSISTPRKKCSEIQANILSRYSSLADQTSLTPSSDYIQTARKTASGNSCKNFEKDPMVGSKVIAILTPYSSLGDQTSSKLS